MNIELNYTVIEGFDKPNGKFPTVYGNTAIVDCHDFFNNFMENIYKLFLEVAKKDTILYLSLETIYNSTNAFM